MGVCRAKKTGQSKEKTTCRVPHTLTPDQIVKKSRSNLAFALSCLPRARREAMIIFYAFCRVVDDLADEPGFTLEERQAGLDRWKDVVRGRAAGLTSFETQVQGMMQAHGVPAEEMLEIIAGMEMDFEPRRFATWEELRQYCYRVACCVGLASIRIFGCTAPQSRDYALHLGYALQITNILRDIRGDWENGQRLYLPLDILARHGVSEQDIAAGQATPHVVAAVMEIAGMARGQYALAGQNLTRQDRLPLLAAEAMRRIYSETLAQIQGERAAGIFSRRYRLSTFRKGLILLGAILRGQWYKLRGV